MMWLNLILAELNSINAKGGYKGRKRSRSTGEGAEGLKCRWCGSRNVIKYGKKGGRQQYKCKDCGRQMIEKPKYKRMREEDLKIAIKMRDEGMSYAAIGRVLGYAESTIRKHIKKKP